MHKGKLTNVNPPRITTEPKMFCEKTKVFFSKHFPLNFLADLMH
jgi:hypothetical protein